MCNYSDVNNNKKIDTYICKNVEADDHNSNSSDIEIFPKKEFALISKFHSANIHEHDIIDVQKKDILISALLKYLYDNEFKGKSNNEKRSNYCSMIKLFERSGLIKTDIASHEYDVIRDNILENIMNLIKLYSYANNKCLSKSHICDVDLIKSKQNIDINTLVPVYNDFYKNFKIIKKIASGAYGTIYEVKSYMDDKLYALKKTKYKRNTKKKWNIEAKIISAFNHTNIVKYYSSWIDFDFTNETKNGIFVYIQIELCDTDLAKLLIQFDYEQRKYHIHALFKQILFGVKYLHSKQIIHRDLKPSNILIKLTNDNLIAKISDFGCSKIVDSDIHFDQMIPSSNCIGTEKYIAPEIENYKHHDYSSDIYSLGVILYEMISCPNIYKYKNNNIRNNLDTNNQIHQLIIKMLNDDPTKRPDINELIALWNRKIIKQYFR